MPDQIERIIRRDLDQLPVLPRERWLPAAPRVWSRIRTGVFRLAASLAVIALALVVGASLTQVRSDLAKSSNAAATATAPASAFGVAGQRVISRQAAIARVAQLSAELPHIQRIEAKLVGADQMRSFNPGLASQPSNGLWWVVAVSGDLGCYFCFMAPSVVAPSAAPYHSAVYGLNARTGDVVSVAASIDYWPSGFDSLPDQTLAASSVTLDVTIDQVVRPNTLIVTIIESGRGHTGAPVVALGRQVTLRADDNTAFAWQAGLAGGTARSLDALLPNGAPSTDILNRVTFDATPGPDGSYRLESLVTGINTR